MNLSRWLAPLLAVGLLIGPVSAPAQTPPLPAAAPVAAPAPAAALSQDLLDWLLAPIALYPDQLLSQVLMASTYPLEVVEAARFVKANPNLRGAALDNALRDRNWDASVLSLCAFPQVLDMMNDQLEWTQRLGDAFLADQAGVMRTVQQLRERAQQAGNLQSSPQQNVIVQDRAIVIEPAQPEYVYVPVYNPAVMYGPWWVPDYTPWYWYPPPIWGYPLGLPSWWGFTGGFFWGTAWAITANNWGWCRPDWGGHNVHIDAHGHNMWLDRPYYHDRYAHDATWSHAPEHRRGVAYRDPVTSNRYRPTNPSAVQTRESFRGRDLTGRPVLGQYDRTAPGAGTSARPGGPTTGGISRSAPGAGTRPSTMRSERSQPGAASMTRPAPGGGSFPGTFGAIRPTPQPSATVARPMTRSMPSGVPAQPAYRLDSRPQVQREAIRGAQSRAAMQPRSQSAPAMMQRQSQSTPAMMQRQQSAPAMRGGGQSGGQRSPGGQPGGRGGAAPRQH